MHEGKPVLNIQLGAMVHRRLVYLYLLNVPSFSSRYFNKIKWTSRLGRLLALSLEILFPLYGFCICMDSAVLGRSTPTTAFDGAIWYFAATM